MIVHIRIKAMAVDNKAADAICGRVMSKHPSCLRMTRQCLSCFEEAGKPSHTCYLFPDDLVYFLVQAGLGPMYGLYSMEGSVELADNPEMKDLLKARFGNDWVGVRNRTLVDGVIRLPSTELSVNVEAWMNFVKFQDCATLEVEPARRTKEDSDSLIWIGKLRQDICTDVARYVFFTKLADNPFHRLKTGLTTGISRSTTADVLHSLKSGVVRYVLDIIIGNLTDSEFSELDLYVERLLSQGINGSSHCETLPRVSFRKGYSKLTELSADERMGQLFVLSFVLSTKKSREILKPLFERKFGDQEESEDAEEVLGHLFCRA